MVLSNALITLGLAVVTYLAQEVPLSPDSVPRRAADLIQVIVGDPHSPVALFFKNRDGAMYVIRDGAIDMFDAKAQGLNW